MKTTTSILLVEDDADDVFFISRALRSSGLDGTLEVANNGEAAVDFLTNAAKAAADTEAPIPCLVLLDLNIPFKSGLEVLRWIRAHPVLKTVVVVVLTSSTSESDMAQAYTLGANSYVVKPSDATRLAEFSQFLKGYWFGWNQLPPVCRTTATTARVA